MPMTPAVVRTQTDAARRVVGNVTRRAILAELPGRLYEVLWEKIGLGRPNPAKAVPTTGRLVE